MAVVLAGRYRSGSSFTGELLSSHPDVFYIYEPLLGAFDHMNITHTLINLTAAETDEYKRQVILNTLTCESNPRAPVPATRGRAGRAFSRLLDKFVCRDQNIANRSCKHTKSYREAFRFYSETGNRDRLFSDACHLYRYSAVKTIRLQIATIAPLVGSTELDLKTLHLVRDPRGMLNSWFMYEATKNGEEKLRKQARLLCSSMLQDVEQGKLLKQNFPNSYKLLRYEDLSRNPKVVAEEVFRFLEIPINDAVVQFIDDNTDETTSSTRRVQTVQGTYRKNSTATAMAWQTMMTREAVTIVEKECGMLMNLLRYEPLRQA